MSRVTDIKQQVLEVLGYTKSPNYSSVTSQKNPLTSHLFRSAQEAGVEGVYLVRTDPQDKEALPARPMVYVAEATTPDQARKIHRSLWNLGNIPFLIVILPNQIRIYTCFGYDKKDEKRGLIESIEVLSNTDLKKRLANYTADSIDYSQISLEKVNDLSKQRVDISLLENLKKLEEVLTENKLDIETAHALIGKYIYIRYLLDREILSASWLEENGIDINSVLSRDAKKEALQNLISILDKRFNGHIFPFPKNQQTLKDEHVSIAAAAFKGDDPISGQIPLFDLYDFSYIPIETLSSVYEQFLHSKGKGKKEGVIYTPEPLADYLVAHLNSVKPLEKGVKVLDPCCGSGIFLVLAYRKIIETELLRTQKASLSPQKLSAILTKSIFGVERDKEACYVTGLSLILTMLSYISPRDLHLNQDFQFPQLHNKQIFEADFFDDKSHFWQLNKKFDWIIGNPPWTKPKKDDCNEKYAIEWINTNKNERPVTGNRIVEAFSWRVVDLVSKHGYIGLIIDATSLFNHNSEKYRKEFFKNNQIRTITNFANMQYVLFQPRATVSAAAIVYTQASQNVEKQEIVHYGPFTINQSLSRTGIITINENEITTVLPKDAEKGESIIWKFALWATHRDKKAITRLKRFFSKDLEELIKAKNWNLHQGLELKTHEEYRNQSKDKIEEEPTLRGQKYLDSKKIAKSGCLFHIPPKAFQTIPDNKCFIRSRGGTASFKKALDVHIIFNVSYKLFTNESFIFISHQRLSAPSKDADELRALAVFFSSSLLRYYLFFQSPAWGISRGKIYKEDILKLPIPNFTTEQVSQLAQLQKELADKEANKYNKTELQQILDSKIEEMFKISKNISLLATDFIQTKLPLITAKRVNKTASDNNLREYGKILQNELDQFIKQRAYHKISFIKGTSFIVCEIDILDKPSEIVIEQPTSNIQTFLDKLYSITKQQFSQWTYIQRSLLIFDGVKVYICKNSRFIEWTKSQALNDSDDLIAEILHKQR